MKYQRSGSILIYIVLMSTTVLIILAALLQQVSVVFTDVRDRYYNQLAEEAAEAGAEYASACLDKNAHRQSWGQNYFGGGGADRPDLVPSADCEGTASAYPSNQYVYDDGDVRTRFIVGALDDTQEQSALISATGIVEVISGGTVVDSREIVIKKTITWDPNLIAEKNSSGTTRTCGLLGGNAYCWGTNQVGQLGNGTTTDSIVPVTVNRTSYPGGLGNKRIIDIMSAGSHNCVIIETNEVYCWGGNNAGTLGDGTFNDSSQPVRVTGLDGMTVIQLAGGNGNSCALTNTGNVYCWGANQYGQLGQGTASWATRSNTPVLVAGPATSPGNGGAIGQKFVSSISRSGAFQQHLCAVALGRAYCWGYNTDGAVGDNSTTDRTRPTAVNTSGALSGKTVTMIAVDGSPFGDKTHTCALAYTSSPADAKPYCWGSNQFNEIGNGSSTYGNIYRTPQAVSVGGSSSLTSGMVITELAVNDVGACVIAYTPPDEDTSRAHCWGRRDAVGRGASQAYRNPRPVAVGGVLAGATTTDIIGGAQRMCANSEGRAYCWGANGVGQIGAGYTSTIEYNPTEAIFLRPRTNQLLF